MFGNVDKNYDAEVEPAESESQVYTEIDSSATVSSCGFTRLYLVCGAVHPPHEGEMGRGLIYQVKKLSFLK